MEIGIKLTKSKLEKNIGRFFFVSWVDQKKRETTRNREKDDREFEREEEGTRGRKRSNETEGSRVTVGRERQRTTEKEEGDDGSPLAAFSGDRSTAGGGGVELRWWWNRSEAVVVLEVVVHLNFLMISSI